MCISARSSPVYEFGPSKKVITTLSIKPLFLLYIFNTDEVLCFGFFIFPELRLCNVGIVFLPLILIVAIADLPSGVERPKKVLSFFLFTFVVALIGDGVEKHKLYFL